MKMMTVAAAISDAISISSSRSRIRRNINVPLKGWPNQTRPFVIPAASVADAFPRQRKGLRAQARKPRSSVSVGRATRLLEEFVDQGLADAAGDVLVDRLHRLSHVGVLLRRQRHDLALAGLLDLGERVVIFLGRLVVAVLGGFLHRLFAGGAD